MSAVTDLETRLAYAAIADLPNTGPLAKIGHRKTQDGDKRTARRTYQLAAAVWTAKRFGEYGQVVGFAQRRRA